MLERTVQELKGAPIDDELTTSINLSVDVRIPEDFIQDMGQRLRTYKRISSAASEAELSEIAAELEDRYGRCPDAVRNLFQYAQLKSFATKCGVLSIDRDGRQLTVKFSERAKINADKLINFVAGNKEVSFSPSGVLKLKLPENILETSDATALFQTTENLLRGFAKLA
jgi:transcription-repair coupling factor (superfamily II helicase)